MFSSGFGLLFWLLSGPYIISTAAAPLLTRIIKFPNEKFGTASPNSSLVIIFLAGYANPDIVGAAKAGAGQANLLRAVFFGLCFFSIGLVTNVRKLWKAGLGRVVGVYAIALVGFIIWVGLFISYIFYHGIVPPTI